MLPDVRNGSSAPFPRCPRNVGLSSDSGRIAALPRTVETGHKPTSALSPLGSALAKFEHPFRVCQVEANLLVRRRANNVLTRTTWPVVKICTDSAHVVVDALKERSLRHM